MPIAKIIHQMWIGPKIAPYRMMNSWREKNPDYEYIFWNEEEIEKRCMKFKCVEKINSMTELNGKCDIMRWEILNEYGGIFIDADSYCIEPLGDTFINNNGFATYENEIVRRGLIATGTMGFEPKNALCGDIIDWIYNDINMIQSYCAWYSVGPGCLTRFIETGNYPTFTIFPSYLFLPQHHTGICYEGHKKVYGYQEWCTSKQSYDTVNEVMIPSCLLCPLVRISVLISSYNTREEYIKDCLNSIVNQVGLFYIEIVWCNDGSDEEHSMMLENELKNTMDSSRFINIKYIKTIQNDGLSECLSNGVLQCSNEYIFRMDSDDVMTTRRISKQYKFMTDNPDIVICGGGMKMFDENGDTQDIFHREEFKWVDFVDEKVKPSWIMNHPTLCYKKSAILEVGNYNKNYYENNIMEDYDLELRFMKKYGVLYNIPEILIYYRIHKEQISKKILDKDKDTLFRKILKKLIG
jgi:hypothetical protein